jgi:hypothetical protein
VPSEGVFWSIGGVPLLELWTAAKGGVSRVNQSYRIGSYSMENTPLVECDLPFKDGAVTEPPLFVNSKYTATLVSYYNALLQRLALSQHFLALVQVELSDLNLV